MGLQKKKKKDNSMQTHKVRLVAKEFELREAIDFDNIFAPIMKCATIRLLVILAIQES